VLNRSCIMAALGAALWLLAAGRSPAQEDKADKTTAAHAAEPSSAHAESGVHTTESHDPAHGAGHPEDTDLSHGNASPAMHDPADARFDLSIYSFIVFLLLLAVLYKFAWGPIALALERRENTIHRQIEEARLASERASAQLKEYEARLAAATDEARQIVGQARKDAEVARDKVVAEAHALAQREREKAVAEIGMAKNQALDAIAQKSVQTAVSLARNILRREVRPQEHEALIGEAVNELSKMNGS
jgi:F-type H+-transporting ATPase subunit b